MPEFQAVAIYKEDYKRLVAEKISTRKPIYFIVQQALDKFLWKNKCTKNGNSKQK